MQYIKCNKNENNTQTNTPDGGGCKDEKLNHGILWHFQWKTTLKKKNKKKFSNKLRDRNKKLPLHTRANNATNKIGNCVITKIICYKN